MRFPSLKSCLVFAAGGVSCLAGLIALLVLASYLMMRRMDSGEGGSPKLSLQPPTLFATQPADFNLSAVDRNSKTISLEDYRGRVIVLNIWATWCFPCMAELPSLGKLASHYSKNEDVAVICVSEEPADTIFKNKSAQNSGAPICALAGGKLPAAYQTQGIPATFLIGRDGMITAKHIGSADWSHPTVISCIDAMRQQPVNTPSHNPASGESQAKTQVE